MTGPKKQTSTYNAANRLTTDGKSTYSYDANGNLTERRSLDDGAVTTYTYDAEDRLIRVVTPKAEVSFPYDLLGRRIEKRVLRWHDEDGDQEPDEAEERPPRHASSGTSSGTLPGIAGCRSPQPHPNTICTSRPPSFPTARVAAKSFPSAAPAATADTRNRTAHQYAYDPLDLLHQVEQQESQANRKVEEALAG